MQIIEKRMQYVTKSSKESMILILPLDCVTNHSCLYSRIHYELIHLITVHSPTSITYCHLQGILKWISFTVGCVKLKLPWSASFSRWQKCLLNSRCPSRSNALSSLSFAFADFIFILHVHPLFLCI